MGLILCFNSDAFSRLSRVQILFVFDIFET